MVRTTIGDLCEAVVEPDWPVLDQAGYEALPTDPPDEGGYFRGQDGDGHRLLLCWRPGQLIPVLHCVLWGIAAERRN
jgi:hypothetical protein